jgi:hypothetical protein
MVRALVCFIVFASACHCGEQARRAPRAPAVEPPREQVAAPEPTESVEPPPPPPPGPRIEAAKYNIAAETVGTGYRVGRPGKLAVVVELADTYTFHEGESINLRLRAPLGVGISQPILARADAARSTSTLTRFEIPIRPTQSGEANVDAFVRFVICQTPETCEPHEEQVMLSMTVE